MIGNYLSIEAWFVLILLLPMLHLLLFPHECVKAWKFWRRWVSFLSNFNTWLLFAIEFVFCLSNRNRMLAHFLNEKNKQILINNLNVVSKERAKARPWSFYSPFAIIKPISMYPEPSGARINWYFCFVSTYCTYYMLKSSSGQLILKPILKRMSLKSW